MRDTFVKAFRHLDQFRKESRFSTWLTRIAVNEAIQKRNARKNFVPLAEVETAEEHFTPKRHKEWKSNPERLYGKPGIHPNAENAIHPPPHIYRHPSVPPYTAALNPDESPEDL